MKNIKTYFKFIVFATFLIIASSIIPTQNTYADTEHCINLSIGPSANNPHIPEQPKNDSKASLGIIKLCGTNLDSEGRLQEGSNFQQSWPCVEGSRKGEGCSYQEKFAYFDWNPNTSASKDIIIKGDQHAGMNGSMNGVTLGTCTWKPGDRVEVELQNCIKNQLLNGKRPDGSPIVPSGYTVLGVTAGTASDYYSEQQKEALDQQQEVMGYDPVDNEDHSDGTVETNCYNSGGAASLGWIICPILDIMGDAAEKMYEGTIKPALQVDPVLFNQDANSGTRQAWGIFQNFANIVFVIILLVVIFSQLTGVGIDNYGIKKILPKLIIVAILVNLSYIICTICVDLSNIVGNSVQNLMNGIDVNVSTVKVTEGDTVMEFAEETWATGWTSVAMVGVFVLAIGSMWANPAIILSLLISVLGVVISVLFLFLLLSVRQAAIVVLTVLSPLAFICYALPNTKNIFDKWLKIGEGLLMVYPIAGLLVGGGDFVSRLLMASGVASTGFFGALTAMIVGIVPIFFIPSVLRSAFAALGQIGAKISGAGTQLSRYTTSKARGSEFNKSMQQMGLERKHRINAGEDTSFLGRGVGNIRRRYAGTRLGRLTGANRRLAHEQRTYAKIERDNEAATADAIRMNERREIDKTPAKGNFAAKTREAYYANQLDDAVDNGGASKMLSTLTAMSQSGLTPGRQNEVFRAFANSDKFKNLDEGTKSRFLREVGSRFGDGFLAKDAEAKNWAQRGGIGNNGEAIELGDYGDYAERAVANGWMTANDIKPEDGGKLNDKSTAALISTGLITQQSAQRIIANNKNLAESNLVMLGATGDGRNLKGQNVNDIVKDTNDIMKNGSGSIGGTAVDNATYLRWTSPQPMKVQNVNGGGAPGGGGTPPGGGSTPPPGGGPAPSGGGSTPPPSGGPAPGGGGTPPPSGGGPVPSGGGTPPPGDSPVPGSGGTSGGGAPTGGGTGGGPAPSGGPASGAGGGPGPTPTGADGVINTYRTSSPRPDTSGRYAPPAGFSPDILSGGVYRHRDYPNLEFDPLNGTIRDTDTGTVYPPHP